jgi:hypothetical protein
MVEIIPRLKRRFAHLQSTQTDQQDPEQFAHPSRPKTAFKRGAPRPPSAIRHFSVSPDTSRPTSAFAAPHLLPRSIAPGFRAQSAPTSSPLSKGALLAAPPSSLGTSHRRYTPVHPTCNLLLAKIWDDAAQKRHLQKLAHIKPQIDNQAPKHFDHLTHRSKKAQLQQGICHFLMGLMREI